MGNNNDRWEPFLAILTQLIDDGFPLYTASSNKLLRLNKSNLNVFNSILNIRDPFLPQETISALCRQHGLVPEQTHVLDGYQMELLQSGYERNKVVQHTLKVSLLERSPCPEYIVARLVQSIPRLASITLDRFSTTTIKNFEQIHQAYPGLEKIIKYERFLLNDKRANELINSGTCAENGYTFTLDNLSTIAALHVALPIAPAALRAILLQVPQLEELVLVGTLPADDFTDGIVLPKVHLLHLLQHVGGAGSGVKKLFSITPNVKKISLTDCVLDGDFIPENQLKSCETLLIKTKTVADFSELFAQIPNVKQVGLELADSQEFKHTFEWPFLRFLELYEIVLSRNNINLLWKKAKLAYLSFNPKQMNETDFANETDLSALYLLRLVGASCTVDLVEGLLNATPQLTELFLSQMNVDGNFSKLQSLATLEKFFMAQTKIDCSFFLYMPRLQNAYLHENELMGSFDKAAHFSFLQILRIFKRGISSANLRLLLSTATRLKRLELFGGVLFHEDFTEGVDLSSLQSLAINLGDSIVEPLQKLLKKTTALESLVLAKAAGLPRTFFQDFKYPNLNQLALEVPIYSEQFKDLLLNAPNLKMLTLQHGLSDIPLNWPHVRLLHLETLRLNRFSAKKKNLTEYLFWAPNLKTLDLLSSSYTGNHDELSSLKEGVVVAACKKITSAVPTLISNGSTQSVVASVPALLRHSADVYRNHIPTPADFKFTYKGDNKHFNQKKVIEKLSQYLFIMKREEAIIPRIQGGICTALSYLFLAHPLVEWFPVLVNWDGREDTLNSNPALMGYFEILLDYVKNYQLGFRPGPNKIYLGDNLESFLRSCPPQLVFYSPWHAIAVKYDAVSNTWFVYDPESLAGPNACAQDQLSVLLKQSLGPLISVDGVHPAIVPCIMDRASFIAEGGLHVLATQKVQNINQLLALLSPAISWTQRSVMGLLLRSINGTPAWIAALMLPRLMAYTVQLLQAFKQHYPQQHQQFLLTSMAVMPFATIKQLAAQLEAMPHHPELAYCIDLFKEHECILQLQTWTKPHPLHYRHRFIANLFLEGRKSS